MRIRGGARPQDVGQTIRRLMSYVARYRLRLVLVVLCIILYIVGVSIYLFVKFVRKKLDEARDRRFQKEHQVNPMAETAKEKPDEK